MVHPLWVGITGCLECLLNPGSVQSVEEIPELGLQHKHSQPPFLEIRWDMLQHNSSIIYLKSVSFTLQVRSHHPSKVCYPCTDREVCTWPNAPGQVNVNTCLRFQQQRVEPPERLQDMDLVLEEEFLELMVHLFRNLPMGDIWQTDMHPSQSTSDDQEAEILQHLQVGSPRFPMQPLNNGQGQKVG